MQDLYLSFTDEAQAKAVLYADHRQNYLNIDTIGVIYKPTGATTEQDGVTVPVMAPIPGWHVNVRVVDLEDDSPLKSFQLAPKTPVRVWG